MGGSDTFRHARGGPAEFTEILPIRAQSGLASCRQVITTCDDTDTSRDLKIGGDLPVRSARISADLCTPLPWTQL